MGCIAGTVEEPRKWVDLRHGQARVMDGRGCRRTDPRTSRQDCSSCIAYRGRRWDGTVATGLTPAKDAFYSMRIADYEEMRAVEDTFDDRAWKLWWSRMVDGLGARALREAYDEDAMEAWAEYMREWRARRDDEQRERDRAAKREYMRGYMRSRRAAAKAAAVSVSTVSRGGSIETTFETTTGEPI